MKVEKCYNEKCNNKATCILPYNTITKTNQNRSFCTNCVIKEIKN